MNLPKFNAESALSKPTRTYRGSPRFGSFAQSGVSGVMPSQYAGYSLDEYEAGLEAGDAGAEEEYASEEGSEEDSGEDTGEDAGEDADEGSEG